MSLTHIPSFRRSPTADQNTITLLDQTTSKQTTQQEEPVDVPRTDSDAPSIPPTPGTDSGGLYKRLTNNSVNIQQSVRQQLAKQKYSRYNQDRYDLSDGQVRPSVSDAPPDQPPNDEEVVARSYFERAQAKARATLRRKKGLGRGKDEKDTVIDILYENQRGMFLFGIPKYSSSSLLPTDAKPWQNAQFRTSASDIRNAQVPDPSWEWVWKSWYVDMSRDVDEEGWEYSFAFVGQGGKKLAWHGNHPWFNSFVRRRRWLRMRRRRDLTHHTREKAHELTADYFTIHPKTLRPSSLIGSQNQSATLMTHSKKADESESLDKMEITNIADLFRAMRKATVDRERLLVVQRFIEEGGDDLIYLSDRMDDVMGMLIFQHSRRQLLGDLIARHDSAHEKKRDLSAHEHDDDEENQTVHDTAARHIEYLLKAVHAADEHVKRLEYWSDMKEISSSVANIDSGEGHHQPSFRNKQEASEGAPELHKHPEHQSSQRRSDSNPGLPAKSSGVWFDAVSQQPSPALEGRKPSDEKPELERFTTAAESESELSDQNRRKGKGRAKASALDGVEEEANVKDLSEKFPKPLDDDAGSHAAAP